MNKDRRNQISNLISEIEMIKTRLESVLAEEEMVFDNMPENLQYSMRGEESQEAIEYMNEAVSGLEEALENLNEIQ